MIDPRTNELRYIGKTLYLEQRYKDHLTKQERTYKYNWIKSMLADNVKPDLFVIEEVDESQWQESERFWINYFTYIGCRLVNDAEGGYGGRPSPSAIEKIRVANTGRKFSDDARRKMSEAKRGRKLTPEWIAKISKSFRENSPNRPPKVMSESSREKIRKSRLGKSLSEETRAKISIAGMGRKHRPESIEKMRLIATGKPNPNLAERNRLGLSAESRKKISDSIKRLWANGTIKGRWASRKKRDD